MQVLCGRINLAGLLKESTKIVTKPDNKQIMKYKILLLLIFYPFLRVSAQNKDYAISIVDTLTSQSMHGRGYVNDGNRIAAEFIRKEFKKAKLKHFGKDYFQPFSYPMNTFQDTIDVFVDDNRLVPGRDFVLYGFAGVDREGFGYGCQSA